VEGRIQNIRDFRFAKYIMDGLELRSAPQTLVQQG
jgi:hypothetical protein